MVYVYIQGVFFVLKNNLFGYATKELSQDAVICWLLNWIKYPESELFEMGKEMFALIGEEAVDANQEITIRAQFKKADIVIVLHGAKRIIVIEDKVYSSEHSNQIENYKKTLKKDLVQSELGIKGDIITDIKTVYFKTGFFYDDDVVTASKVDKAVMGNDFYKLIKSFKDKFSSEILDYYEEYLRTLLEYYDKYGKFEKCEEGAYYVSRHTIAQYKLMRTIFPEKWNKSSDQYKIKHGTSSGRPWTEMNICHEMQYPDGDKYCIFWRVDTDKRGPYISLRYYEYFDKNESKKLKRHEEYYAIFVGRIKQIVEYNEKDTQISWNTIKCGYRGSYKESALISIPLGEYLNNWDEVSESFIKAVRILTTDFLATFDECDVE